MLKNFSNKSNIFSDKYKIIIFFSDARKFFEEEYELNIDDFESGSDVFMRELFAKAQCQISVFSDAENYKRVKIVPEKYNPLLSQVNILQTQYLLKTEAGKTVR